MSRRRYLALAFAIVSVAIAGSAIAQSNSKEIMAMDPAKLIEMLKDPDASNFQIAKACQRLAVAGTADAIPALAALLPNEELNLYARYGLEGIPHPMVDEALRDATTKLEGRQLVGVLSSIGQRRDAKAVRLLKGLLGSDDPTVASAAAGALGRIGTSDAADVLEKALAQDSPLRIRAGDACLACAEGLADAGESGAAVALYEAVGDADLPKYLKIATLEGQFRVLKTEAKDLLLQQLRSEDDAFFNLGLAVAREMSGAEVTVALAGELDSLPAQRQALLLLTLGDRKDPVPLPSVLAASKSDSAAVRDAAISILAKLGDASAVPVLLKAALGDTIVAATARDGLKTLADQEVDKAIVAKLADADARAKPVLFDIVAARRIAAADPLVREALSDSDPGVRLAAITALGQLIELKDLDLLIARSLKADAAAERAIAREALKTAALRMGDRDACAEKLAANLNRAPADNQVYLLELLGDLSGKRALETVVANAKSNDDTIKDAATRVLGQWPNAGAAPALLDIAKNDAQAKYRIRTLRGYIRIARQLQLPEDARLKMFHTAMELATRDDEKWIALDILSRIPSPVTLQLAVSYLGESSLKEEAVDAAVKIAAVLVGTQPKPVAEAMQKVVDARVGGRLGPRARQLLEQARAGSK